MIWIFWLYLVPALLLLTFIIPCKDVVDRNIWNVLVGAAVFPVFNLIIVLGVIWKLCTIKDLQSYVSDSEVQDRLAEFEKQINDIMNKNK